MIKVAEIEDFETVMKLGQHFIEAQQYQKITDLEQCSKMCKMFLMSPKTERIIILYEDKGVIVGTLTPMIFSPVKVATEFMWWVEPEFRNQDIGTKLLEAFEYWASQVGAENVVMTCLDDEVGKFYEKNGYALMERVYIKKI